MFLNKKFQEDDSFFATFLLAFETVANVVNNAKKFAYRKDELTKTFIFQSFLPDEQQDEEQKKEQGPHHGQHNLHKGERFIGPATCKGVTTMVLLPARG